MKGQVKQQWGRLTDDRLDRISGRFEELSGLIQEKYGYTRENAEQALNTFLAKVTKSPYNQVQSSEAANKGWQPHFL